MDDCVQPVVPDHLANQGLVLGAANHQGCVADGLAVTEFQTVEHHHEISACPQQRHCVRSNIAGAAGD